MTTTAAKPRFDIVAMMRAMHGVPDPKVDQRPSATAKQPFSLAVQMRAHLGLPAEQETTR